MWTPVWWLWPSPVSSVGRCRTGLPLEFPGWELAPVQSQAGSQHRPPPNPSAAQPLHCTWQPWVQLIIVSALSKPQECETPIDLFTLPRSSIKKNSRNYTTARETNCTPCFSAIGYSRGAFESHCDSHSCVLTSILQTLGSYRYASSVTIIFMAFSLRLIWHSARGYLTVWLVLTDIIGYFEASVLMLIAFPLTSRLVAVTSCSFRKLGTQISIESLQNLSLVLEGQVRVPLPLTGRQTAALSFARIYAGPTGRSAIILNQPMQHKKSLCPTFYHAVYQPTRTNVNNMLTV